MDKIPNYFSQTNNTTIINGILGLLLIIILVFLIMYIQNQIHKSHKKDSNMKNYLNDVDNNITSVNPYDAEKSYNLGDYYIMSSYNSCCNGNFKDGYVSLNALSDVISRGARVLDFEIYNIDNNPVVACSNSNDFNFKGSYNSIPFADVIELISKKAFSSSAPNQNDPLIIHLRIKTNNTKVCDKVGKIIADGLDRYRLDDKYNNEYNIGGKLHNLMEEPLVDFMRKAIIMVDRSNTTFVGTHLQEVTNLSSSTFFCNLLRNYDIVYAPSANEIIDHNKKYTTITMCDLANTTPENMSAMVHMKFGCQMICMNFQNVDEHLVFYLEQFNKSKSAFKLKPAELRYIPVKSKVPTPQKKELSYAPRVVSKPYFSHTI